MTAHGALMHDDILFLGPFNGDRFHQPAASGLPVARIYVDMQAIQAFWTMIGKSVSARLKTAFCADEIFFIFLERAAHEKDETEASSAAGIR